MTDWSGVVSDDRLSVYETNARMFEARELPRLSYDDWLRSSTASVREIMAQRGIEEDPELLFEEYERTLNIVIGEGIRPSVYSDAHLFFSSLASISLPIVVVSSHPAPNLQHEACEYGLESFISRLIGGVKNKKEVIESVLGSTPRDKALYVGDTIYDIAAARFVGVIPVGITTGYHSRNQLLAHGPDLLVDSLSELKTLLGA